MQTTQTLTVVADAGLGDTLAVNGSVTVNDDTVLQADVAAESGVSHVIDRVLIPAA